jgi:hypothetical protein
MLTQPCIKSVTLATGSSSNAASGSIYIESGKSGRGGNITLQSGASDEVGGSTLILGGDGIGGGGPMFLMGGKDLSTDEDTGKAGGMVRIEGGLSTVGDGGTLSIAGGSSENGMGGSVNIESGSSVLGQSGSILIKANPSEILDGGDISVEAGRTTGLASKGGSILIAAGDGADVSEGDGGDGGTLTLRGGLARGSSFIDAGGDAIFQGGDCEYMHGHVCFHFETELLLTFIQPLLERVVLFASSLVHRNWDHLVRYRLSRRHLDQMVCQAK